MHDRNVNAAINLKQNTVGYTGINELLESSKIAVERPRAVAKEHIVLLWEDAMRGAPWNYISRCETALTAYENGEELSQGWSMTSADDPEDAPFDPEKPLPDPPDNLSLFELQRCVGKLTEWAPFSDFLIHTCARKCAVCSLSGKPLFCPNAGQIDQPRAAKSTSALRTLLLLFFFPYRVWS
jgi:hypothetical protein